VVQSLWLIHLKTAVKLQWTYEEQEQNLKPKVDLVEFIAPPTDQLLLLHELAMKGNFIGITKQARLIEQMDSKYRPFAKELQKLAKGFQDQKILALIQTYK